MRTFTFSGQVVLPCSVYILNMHGTNFYKIGVANDVEKRLSQINCGPIEIDWVSEYVYVNRDLAYNIEQGLHAMFYRFRHKNEWYRFSRYTLGIIDEMLVMTTTDGSHYNDARHKHFAPLSEIVARSPLIDINEEPF